MPWVRQGNEHVFYQVVTEPAVVRSAEQKSETDTAHVEVSTGSAEIGTWCQWTGTPPWPSYWLERGASAKLEDAHSQVEVAEPNSKCVAGVVVAQNKIKTDGVTLAWVIKKKRTLELSGLYSTTENGIHVANTAIIQRGNFFVMARSKDDELQTLISKFAELTE